MEQFKVLDKEIKYYQANDKDYISLTDMVKNIDNGLSMIERWLRNKDTIEFLGTWEGLYNPDFNSPEFEGIRNRAGTNRFQISVKQWVGKTNSKGILAKAGRYGGTYAHKDIAFEFAAWVSPQFKLYLIREFDRLKQAEYKKLGWDIKRNLTKINYAIHTDAIKNKLLPVKLTVKQTSRIYADEADVLNIALFGITASDWRRNNKDKAGNIRDYASVSQLICLSNLENLNAYMIKKNIKQSDRIIELNKTAIYQMELLTRDNRVKMLEEKASKAEENMLLSIK